jgi:hypothetical protein
VKWVLRGLIALTGIAALALLAWVTLLPTIVERELRNVTGFDFHVVTMKANPFTGQVSVEGLAANNPPGYPNPDFVELRALRTRAELYPWIFSKRILVDDLDLDIGQVVIVRRHDGKTNVSELMAVFTKPPAPSTTPTQPVPYLVKNMRLRVEKLVFSDFAGSKPVERSYFLDIDQTYTNVTDWRQLLAPRLVKNLKFGMIQDLVMLFPGNFSDALSGAFRSLGMKLKEANTKAEGFFKNLFTSHSKPKNPPADGSAVQPDSHTP